MNHLERRKYFWEGFRRGYTQGAICIGIGCFVWVLYEVLK